MSQFEMPRNLFLVKDSPNAINTVPIKEQDIPDPVIFLARSLPADYYKIVRVLEVVISMLPLLYFPSFLLQPIRIHGFATLNTTLLS